MTQDSPVLTTPAGAGASGPGEPLRADGLRMLVLGGLLAVLAPLAGFLGGSIATGAGSAEIDPLAVWLFGGLVIGGLGAVVAIVGGLRWFQANRGRL